MRSSLRLAILGDGEHDGDKERRRAQEEHAARTIQKMWWRHLKLRLFKLLKHTICAAEHCISYDILKRVSPLEAELLKDPTVQCKVRFRFAGSEFPPFVVFKIYCKSRSQKSKYISGKKVITSTSEAAIDACKLMGYRKYYKQMLQDEVQNKKYGITDEMDVATIKDYVKYVSYIDEIPSHFGGRHNYWRKLSLENFPRATILYDIMDYAESRKMSARLRAELPFLLLIPQNEEMCRAQVLAVCHIRSPSPCSTAATLSKLDQKSVYRPSERRSYQARQKIAKMRKAYRIEKGGVEPFLSGYAETMVLFNESPSNQSLLSVEDWEKEAVQLYDWARSLRTEDIGED
ncbi:uncharacterized protein CXorf58 homolog [Elgaria multicarinata webbii]|uniref:uncharacterized protein CXorf58 homolog n=1 Tax=Elgaria multicarinata webbii TaxID=159646 RepID=UPI002FCD4C33